MRLIALIIIVVALALESGAMRAEDIKVNKRPTDVPCEALKRNPDGSYTQQKDLMMGTMPMPKKTYGQGDSRGALMGSVAANRADAPWSSLGTSLTPRNSLERGKC